MRLRPYQEADIAAIRAHLRAGRQSVCWQLPTGGGKTAGAAYMAGTASARGRRVWFIVHRRELLRQSSVAFRAAGIQHGLIAAGMPYDPRVLVHIAGIDTLRRRLDSLPAPDILIWDECHHLAAASWSAVFARYPAARHIGLSATPERLDGRGLGQYFQELVTGPAVAELTAAGWLSPYRLFAPLHTPDLSGVHMQAGDFNRRELGAVMGKPAVVGDAVQHYCRLAEGRPTLLFAHSVEASTVTAARFRDAGVSAVHIDAETPQDVRDAAIADLEGNRVKVLCNVDLFGEGVSVNNVACIMQLRPTCSLAMHLQQIGRGLRPYPGKADCIILDHAGNSMRHGLPDDERTWSLAGRDRTRGKADPDALPVKQCPKCYAISRQTASQCRECGAPFPIKPRVVAQVEGELGEVDPAVARQQFASARSKATDLESLAAIGAMRGMRDPHGWARHVLQARQNKGVRR